MHAAGESGLDWRQTVTHRELRTGEPKAEEPGLGVPSGDLTGGMLERVEQPARDQTSGDSEDTSPIQAQEA